MYKIGLIVTIISLFGSFVGFFIQLLIAKNFGAGELLDRYLYAQSIPLFISGLFGSILNFNLPSLVSEAKINNELNKIFINIFTVAILISITLLPFFYLLYQYQLTEIDLISEYYNNAVNFLYLSWFLCFAQLLFAIFPPFFIGLSKPLFATILNTFGPIASLLLFKFSTNPMLEMLLFGNILGVFFAISCSFFVLNRLEILIKLRSIKEFLSLSIIKMLLNNNLMSVLALTCFTVYPVVDAFWGSKSGEGVLSTLGYVQRIIISFGNLAIAGPSALIVPKIMTIIKNNNGVQFKQEIKKLFFFLFITLIPLAFMLAIYSKYFVTILFGRGSFGITEILNVSETLKYYCIGMIFMLFSVIFLRILFCFEKTFVLTCWIASTWVLLYFILCMSFYELGSKGFAISYSITWAIYFILFLLVLYKSYRITF